MKKIIFIIIYCGMIIICKDSKYNPIEESNKFKPIKFKCILVDNTEEYCKKVIPMISKKKSKNQNNRSKYENSCIM